MEYGEWAPYVPVAQRRANAAKEIKKLRKKGMKIEPIELKGKKLAYTFWGKAWCDHLEKFSDYENRLPRGRTYVRNGSVCHLAISKGNIEAIVSGSELYNINIKIAPLPTNKWKHVGKQCAGQIGSMLELLQGHFSDKVMGIVTNQNTGLFPRPSEIKLNCDCPDWAEMCKHIAAVLYGVGARLDDQPELLFILRNVDHEELISTELDILPDTSTKGKRRRLVGFDLSDVFGVEMEEPINSVRKKTAVKKKVARKKKEFPPTATTVTRLRKRLKTNTAQFAKLVGVSPLTVRNWENGSGKLNPRQQNLDALTRVAKLTSVQAMKILMRKR